MKKLQLQQIIKEEIFKLLKEDKQPTHRITVDVYYSEDLGEATPEYELEDMYLSSDDFESTYIDAGMEGWYENGEFKTEGGSSTRLEPEYVEVTLFGYWEDIYEELKDLNSGEKLLYSVNKNYGEMVERNFKNNIDPKKTAQYIRDHWYGA